MSDTRLEDKIPVDNLCNWDLYFRRMDGVGDVRIPANARNFSLLTYNELQLQIQARNPMIIGTDEKGSHARLKITDEELCKELFGLKEENPVAQQFILTLDAVKELLEIKSKSAFTKRLEKLVQTDAEKRMIIDLAKQAHAENVEGWKMTAIEEISNTKFE